MCVFWEHVKALWTTRLWYQLISAILRLVAVHTTVQAKLLAIVYYTSTGPSDTLQTIYN